MKELVLIKNELDKIEPARKVFLEDLLAAVSKNTQRAYSLALKTFIGRGYNIPTDPQNIAEYVRTVPYSVSTIIVHLSAISFAHKIFGFDDPTQNVFVQLALRRVKRERGTQQKMSRPLLQQDVIRILDTLRDKSSLINIRDEALLMVGWSGAFRRSELTLLKVNDIEFNAYGLIVVLRKSKTDQEGMGLFKAISNGKKGGPCPVRSLRTWLSAAHINDGYVFRSMNLKEEINDSISPESIDRIIKKLAIKAKLETYEGVENFRSKYSGHSLRAGFCTTCANLGVPIWKIQKQTGHKNADMVTRYIRNENLFDDNPTSILW